MESSHDYNAGNGTEDALVVSAGIVVTWTLAVITVIGNSIVILAFITEKTLQTNPAYLFILNLAIADFLTGVFSFPLNTLWLMHDYWPFGEVVCKFWLIVDYTACAVSVCCIILISLDRYWMLKLKMKYAQFQTRKRATVMILATWAICIPFYGIPTLFWSKFTGEKIINYSEDCEMESEESLAYNLFIVSMEFLIPVTIISYLNSVVYREIGARTRTSPTPTEGPPSTVVANSHVNVSITVDQSALTRPSTDTSNNHGNRAGIMLKKHKKAAATLAALVIAFAICWTPYNIVLVWSIICEDCLSDSTWETVNYLLWSNSAINPILYALTNLKIRAVFYKFLCVKYFKRVACLT